MTSHPYLLGTLAALGWLLILLTARDLYLYDRAAGEWRPDVPRGDEEEPL